MLAAKIDFLYFIIISMDIIVFLIQEHVTLTFARYWCLEL